MPAHYHPDLHHRRSIHLSGYDYSSAGAYFLTLCTYQREPLFGEIANDGMHLNDPGGIVRVEWLRTASIRREVQVDTFVVMPNHLHSIVLFSPTPERSADKSVGAHGRAPLQRSPKSLGSLVAGFKASATKQINQVRHNPGSPVWQRNYYEHVIRDQAEFNRIREYIAANPFQWSNDDLNSANGIASRSL
ncbi:MAG: transposase [Dehalococcoidia bacterium]|nr:transposase [Dehalococcoidia bacterium]